MKNEKNETGENRESFLKRLNGKCTEEEIILIELAYDLSKEAHRPTQRDGGVRYFEHPREMCLILMDELDIYDANLIIILLLHDVGEDTPLLGNILASYDLFRKKAEWRLKRMFNAEVADGVLRLTKPAKDNIRFHTREDVYSYFFQELEKSEKAILGKMIDRLHNLRSLPNDLKKIKKQVDETESVYIPIFNKICGLNKPHAHIFLLQKIKDQLEILKKSLVSQG